MIIFVNYRPSSFSGDTLKRSSRELDDRRQRTSSWNNRHIWLCFLPLLNGSEDGSKDDI